ncbi:hypothetical protein MAR_035477 [Mya arenaria]|uniref:IBR domain-containing protein n=1 Tax=Mya arenaria TaxID=6604 RepID=A0ABY7ENT9_MYAAR|nr:hypothetical protein MAR_035477 [Mya arenaria]
MNTDVSEFSTILQNCQKKTISNVSNVPSVRSCPNCKEAIEHVDACHNMGCVNCNRHFCFICLEKADDRGNLKCRQPHTVAPVQTPT